MYYDPEPCPQLKNGAWIIDDGRPDAQAAKDLDADQDCQYLARLDSTDSTAPPMAAEWYMFCGDTWGNHEMAFTETYKRITSGSCSSEGLFMVADVDSCLQAGQWIGMDATQVQTSMAVPRPYGCYWDASRAKLMMNSNMVNRDADNSEISELLQPICAASEQDAVAAMTTASAPGLHCWSVATFLFSLLFLGNF